MTVCYNAEVATARPFGFVRLLFRWKGSFYKLIVHQFVIYVALYTTMTAVYAFALNEQQRTIFEKFGVKLGQSSGYVVSSITLCLSFFMQQVYKRFWENFQQVPWPDALAFYVTAYVTGADKRGRLLRRTMVRYAVVSIVMGLMVVSKRMRIMFPTLDFLLLAGFLTSTEVNILKDINSSGRHLVPLAWCAALVKRARLTDKRIEDDFGYNAIIDELDSIRLKCRRLIHYSNFPVPLAYVHTVVLAVYSFFTAAAVAGTHRSETEDLHDTYLAGATVSDLWTVRVLSEVITLLQFAICAGMLAATESLICPFGNNDGDFETEKMVKHHLGISYLIVDDMFAMIPQLSPDEDPQLDPYSESVFVPPTNPMHSQVHSRQASCQQHSRAPTRQSSLVLEESYDDREGMEILYRLSLGNFTDQSFRRRPTAISRIRRHLSGWLRHVPFLGPSLSRRISYRPNLISPSPLMVVSSPTAPPDNLTSQTPMVMRLLSFRRMN